MEKEFLSGTKGESYLGKASVVETIDDDLDYSVRFPDLAPQERFFKPAQMGRCHAM